MRRECYTTRSASWISIFILFFHLAVSMTGQAPSSDLALVGGTIYASPDQTRIADGTILIRGGVIVAVGRRNTVKIPRGIQVLNCRGLAITAGLWNSHVHFIEHKWADVKNLPPAELAAQIEAM